MRIMWFCICFLYTISLLAQSRECFTSVPDVESRLIKSLVSEPYVWSVDSSEETLRRTQKAMHIIPELKLCNEKLDSAFYKQFHWIDLNHDGRMDVILEGPCLEDSAIRVYMALQNGRYKRILRQPGKLIDIRVTEGCAWLGIRSDALGCDPWTVSSYWFANDGSAYLKPYIGVAVHANTLAYAETNSSLLNTLTNPTVTLAKWNSSEASEMVVARSTPHVYDTPQLDACSGDSLKGNVIAQMIKPPIFWIQGNSGKRLAMGNGRNNNCLIRAKLGCYIVGYID